MSVMIKGMKMPNNCTICRFCVPEADPENGEMCMATGKYVPPCNTDRFENCPLVEIPRPQNRPATWGDVYDSLKVLEALLETIEAEEGEEA